jgi:hypothetical protein|tara:strand:- start:2314 stop:2658 length:345 start_codon:yes stop_codon:yes gene_type:complete
MPIGFKSDGQAHALEEGSFAREEKDNSLIDSQTVPRLLDFKKTLGDVVSASILDSYIQLFISGVIDISFDSITGEPIAELIKVDNPRFIIRQPSLMADEAHSGSDSNKENEYLN